MSLRPLVASADAVVSPAPAPLEVPDTTTTTVVTATAANDPISTFQDLADRLVAARVASTRAIDAAVRACMAEQGFEYVARPPIDDMALLDTALPWASLSPDEAAGGDTSRPSASEPATPEDAGGSTAYEHALWGDVIGSWAVAPDELVPAGFPLGGDVYDGCLPSAQTAIIGGGDPRAAFRITDYVLRLQGVRISAVDRTLADQEVATASAAWARCMADAGHRATQLDELATAVADAACRTATDLTAIGDRQYASALGDWLDAHPGDVTEIIDFADAVLARSTT